MPELRGSGSMKAMELISQIGQESIELTGAYDPVAGPEVVFDVHGAFHSVKEVAAATDRIVIVLEPHHE